VASTKPVAAKPVASAEAVVTAPEPVAASETIPAAEAVAKATPPRTPGCWCRLGGARIHAVHRYHLKTPGRILEVAHHGCARRHVGRADSRQRRGMAERVAAVLN